MKSQTESLSRALELAIEARERAHAPYSQFRVGAAVKSAVSNEIFVGCNVENASYGATICAERVAIGSMVSRLGRVALEYVVVVTEANPPACPCGICRQFIAEFAGPELPIHIATPHGVVRTMSLSELLPYSFRLLE